MKRDERGFSLFSLIDRLIVVLIILTVVTIAILQIQQTQLTKYEADFATYFGLTYPGSDDLAARKIMAPLVKKRLGELRGELLDARKVKAKVASDIRVITDDTSGVPTQALVQSALTTLGKLRSDLAAATLKADSAESNFYSARSAALGLGFKIEDDEP